MPRKETMTQRERMLAVLTRKKPDRIPLHYRATEEASAKLMKYLGCSNMGEVYEKLHIDRLIHVGGKYVGPPVPEGYDMFGCQYRNVDYGTGVYPECIGHPLAKYESVEEIEANYTWPTVDWFDYSEIPEYVQGKDEYVLSGGGWEPFLRYKYLRGEEQAFMDLILNPDIVEYCMEKLFNFYYEYTYRILDKAGGKILISSSSEDLGSQTGLLYSPEHIRKYFFPYHKKMIDLMHQAGAYVQWHTDGAVRKIIPDLIGLGVDILDPIQWRCPGMEREGLKRDFGDKLIFHGGVDNQYTLPFGSVEEVRQEVIDNINILGKDGGYILGPCHNIQSVGPAENVVAMYETAYEYGWL